MMEFHVYYDPVYPRDWPSDESWNSELAKFWNDLEQQPWGRDFGRGDAGWVGRTAQTAAFVGKYPWLRLTLYCEADDSIQWVEYYQDGKVQIGDGHVVYPDFSEQQLLDPQVALAQRYDY